MQNRKLLRISIFLIILLVLGLFYNQAANWHFHLLGNGTIIEHAHPFNDENRSESPFPNHTHTAMEYNFLAQFSNVLVLLVFALFLLLLLSRGFISYFSSYSLYLTQAPDLSGRLLRAPPHSV
ncbi:MAG TPA: hypothetical protein VLH37_06885 [Bacteroidales bacterium]|nr:hypothetical protein [Bacteroidales bacterium]